MLQNATLLRKSAPGPPNMSDSCVSCTVPARWNASLQIPSNVPPLPTFLKLLQNHHVLLTFGRVQKPLRLPHKTTLQRPKMVRACGAFNIFDFEICFAPERRSSLFQHLNFQKCSQNGVFCTFLTSKCASCHNGMHFFDMSTTQEWSEPVVLLEFWLPNVLRATTTCNFSSLISPEGSAPAALASLLFDSGTTEHWRHRVFRDFSTVSRTCIFFLLTLSSFFFLLSSFFSLLSSLFSSLLFSSPLPLPLPTSAFFHLSILSEVWLLNFLANFDHPPKIG